MTKSAETDPGKQDHTSDDAGEGSAASAGPEPTSGGKGSTRSPGVHVPNIPGAKAFLDLNTIERLVALLAPLAAALPLIGTVTGATDTARRNHWTMFYLALVLLAFGVFSVIRLLGAPEGKKREQWFTYSLITVVPSLFLFLALMANVGAADSRPMITVSQTGTETVTISGLASSGGLGVDERIGLKIVDGTNELYSAAMGGTPATGLGQIDFSVQVDGRNERDINVVTWIFGHAPDVVNCDLASAPDSGFPNSRWPRTGVMHDAPHRRPRRRATPCIDTTDFRGQQIAHRHTDGRRGSE